jgi:hypothetical protein
VEFAVEFAEEVLMEVVFTSQLDFGCDEVSARQSVLY